MSKTLSRLPQGYGGTSQSQSNHDPAEYEPRQRHDIGRIHIDGKPCELIAIERLDDERGLQEGLAGWYSGKNMQAQTRSRLLLTSFWVATSTLASCRSNSASIDQKAENANPLSFFGGALVFEVEERLRVEGRENNRDFNLSRSSNTDGGWLLNRFRLGVTVQPSSWLRGYIQSQDAREWFSPRAKIPGVSGAEGDDAFDLRQSYIEIADYKLCPLGITIGREAIEYGDRRLIGDSRWGNVGGRTFDWVRARFQEPQFWLDVFVARPVQIKRGAFDDSDPRDNLSGAYFATTHLPKQITELYFFHRDKTGNQPNLSPGNTTDPRGAGNGPAAKFSVLGTRIKSNPGELYGWDYETEMAYEFGNLWVSDLSSPRHNLQAFAAHVASGYTFENSTWKPRFGLEYDYASGDNNAKDDNSESFQNLFPSNHDKYGFMDDFAWRNMHDARCQFNLGLSKNVGVELDYHAFWLASTHDYWFLSNGLTALRTKTPDGRDVRAIGARSFAGHEIDVTVSYGWNTSIKLQCGYSHFFAGSYLADTGAHDDADFGYFMATLTF